MRCGRPAFGSAIAVGCSVYRFNVENRLLLKEIGAQVRRKVRMVAPQPLQDHRGVFDLLAHVMQQDGLELGVFSGIRALLIPVDRLQFLLQGDERTVHVLGGGRKFIERLVIGVTASRHKACTPLRAITTFVVEKCPCQAPPEPPNIH